MTNLVLKAEKREKLGSLEAKKIKKAGRIPAVIYSKEGNINLSVDTKEFEHEYFKGNVQTVVFAIELAGKKIKAIAHKVELDPVSDRPIHIDFLNCDETKQFKAKPKLVFSNQEKSPGLKKGGFLHIVLRKVEISCESEKAIPEIIEIDVGSLQVGNKIRAKDLNLPAGTKLSRKDNFLVASITGRSSKDEEVAAPAAGAEAAAPAAGAAAPAAGAAAPAKSEEKKPAAKK